MWLENCITQSVTKRFWSVCLEWSRPPPVSCLRIYIFPCISLFLSTSPRFRSHDSFSSTGGLPLLSVGKMHSSRSTADLDIIMVPSFFHKLSIHGTDVCPRVADSHKKVVECCHVDAPVSCAFSDTPKSDMICGSLKCSHRRTGLLTGYDMRICVRMSTVLAHSMIGTCLFVFSLKLTQFIAC